MTKKNAPKKADYIAPEALSLSDFGVAYGGPCKTGGSASDCSTGNTAANNCNSGNNAGARCDVGASAVGSCNIGSTPL
jgi:hypothetical protein